MQPDAAADRDLALNRYNLIINDPFANRQEVLRDTIEAMDGDPDRLTSQPAPAQPEKPKINLAISGKDLDPAAPQYQNVVNVLIAAGIPAIPAPAAAPASAEDEPIEPAPVVDRE